MKKQISFPSTEFKKQKSEHGGSHRNPQKRKRPLSLKSHNHFVLRSTKAKKQWSFRRHKKAIDQILKRFAKKHHIGLISYANVGNHLHLNLEISNRNQYRKFIRAISAAIMIKVTGYSRWNKAPEGFRFWDTRPFSRIVITWTEITHLKSYLTKNQWQGLGLPNLQARALVAMGWCPRDG